MREREKLIGCLPYAPDQGLNSQPFGERDNTPSKEATGLGLLIISNEKTEGKKRGEPGSGHSIPQSPCSFLLPPAYHLVRASSPVPPHLQEDRQGGWAGDDTSTSSFKHLKHLPILSFPSRSPSAVSPTLQTCFSHK